MYQLKYNLTTFSIVLIFLFNSALLDLVGWSYTIEGGNIITRIHPAFYTLLIVAGLQLVYGGRPVARAIFSPIYMAFIASAVVVVIRAILIVMTGVTQGELTGAIVTWLLPALLVVALIGWDNEVFERWGVGIRLFMLLNSLMGLAERVVGHRFIPSFLDHTRWLESRASGLLAHPLNASLLTGIMIVILVTARPGKVSPGFRVPEILLHVAAMFAFGGRSALVFTVAILVLSGLLARQSRTERRLGVVQRLLPYLVVLAGFVLVSLPLEFVDATLDRFTNDASSSKTRDSAVEMLGVLDWRELLFGIDANARQILLDYFHTPAGIEISWISLTITYGLLVTVPLAITLPLFLYTTARQLDRSAFYAMLLLLLVTIGSLSIGSKSLLIAQAILMMVTLCRPRLRLAAPDRARPARAPAPDVPLKPAEEPDIPDFLR